MIPDFIFPFLPLILAPVFLSFFYCHPPRKSWIFVIMTLIATCVLLLFSGTKFHIQIQVILLIIIHLLGTVLFFFIFHKLGDKKIGAWIEQLKKNEELFFEAEKKKERLKKEFSDSNKEIKHTLRVYGAMKGFGGSLTWEEMVPHIDYVVQHCLSLKDYFIYLLDENDNFQKVISRGFRLQEPSLQKISPIPQLSPSADNPSEIYLEMPIFHGNLEIGLLWGRCSPTAQIQSEDLLKEAVNLAEALGMGLQKARLFSSMEKLSRIDGLTGVHRRQVFNERISEEVRRARVFRTVFSLLIADLDHFKNINDTYGHQGGDEVLRRVGEILKESIYETDFVARYGGEEFVILFPQADPAGVLRKAETIRRRVEQEIFQIGWNKIQITVSMGTAHYPQDGTDPSALLAAADKALYFAKENGRNQIIDSSQIK